jgi:hypothetical protein
VFLILTSLFLLEKNWSFLNPIFPLFFDEFSCLLTRNIQTNKLDVPIQFFKTNQEEQALSFFFGSQSFTRKQKNRSINKDSVAQVQNPFPIKENAHSFFSFSFVFFYSSLPSISFSSTTTRAYRRRLRCDAEQQQHHHHHHELLLRPAAPSLAPTTTTHHCTMR